MNTAKHNTISNPLQWRLRADLLYVRDSDNTDHDWIIKDPIRLTYFFVSSEGLAFLKLCNGRRTIDELASLLAVDFPGADSNQGTLLRLLQLAVRAGIMAGTAPGYGRILAAQTQTSAISGWMTLPVRLSVRWRGIDPTPILRILHPWVSWVFRPAVLSIVACVAAILILLVLGRWQQLVSELPGVSGLLTFQNVFYVTLTATFVKFLHELGHALTCYHFGGECHELGILWVLVFPIPYCDVTDSWTMSSRRQRMAIAFAGIFVEAVVALICGLLWIFSNPGLLHSYFLNVMLLCSMNTLLVNGNPLLRYDGYYVLSDLIGVPNFASEGRQSAGTMFRWLALGSARQQTCRSPAAELALALWGVASGIYRFSITLTLIVLIYVALKPWGLHLFASLPAMSLIWGVLSMFRSEVRTAYATSQTPRRVSLRLIIIAVIAGFVLLTPISLPVKAPCVITPGRSIPVFVKVSGSIVPAVSAGQQVKAGDLIATLRNDELGLQIAELEGEISLKTVRLSNLELLRLRDSSAAGAMTAAEQSLASARSRLDTLKQLSAELEIRSPRDGVVWMPRNRMPGAEGPDSPQLWSHCPLDPQNQGAWVEQQTLLCWIGSEEEIRVTAVVDESSLQLLETGTRATVRLLSSPETPLQGELEEISGDQIEALDRELLVHQLAPTAPGNSVKPASTCFRAVVKLDPNTRHPALYSTGAVRLNSVPRPLVRWAWRFVSHAFAFRT